VVLDTLESLFSGLPNPGILRSEIRRLFRWLKDRGMTTVITAEQGDGTLTRHGLEEYVSDCVIKLDHRVTELISTRRLRVVKYRGSMHGTNEYPFLIDENGVSVLPLTSVGLDYPVSSERIPTGIARLDTMLDGKGYFRGSSILLSGTAGTGKTSVAVHLATETCRRGEKCLYFAFEESRNQIIRNMRSIGLDLQPWIESGSLLFHGVRPTFYGLEMHLVKMYTLISEFKPHLIIIDPISNLVSVGSSAEVKSVLMRLVDFLKSNGITSFFTSLTVQGSQLERTEEGVSSLIDTWLQLRDFQADGERNRLLHILKSRGMGHSNQVREFLLTEKGIELVDVYIGDGGVFTGTARVAQEARDTAVLVKSRQEIEHQKRELERRRHVIDMQISTMRTDFEREEEEFNKAIEQQKEREKANSRISEKMLHLRKADHF
jgi:circadian clock protein KaiC